MHQAAFKLGAYYVIYKKFTAKLFVGLLDCGTVKSVYSLAGGEADKEFIRKLWYGKLKAVTAHQDRNKARPFSRSNAKLNFVICIISKVLYEHTLCFFCVNS